MTETRTKLVPFNVDKTCPRCPDGLMRPTGMVRPMNPPKYDHKCGKCGHEERYLVSYPYIDYIPEDQE